MKKQILTFLASLLICSGIYSQAPEAINYQAVVRDGAGAIVANQNVGIQLSVLQGSATGTAVYQETFTPSTNTFGLVNMQIGNGAVQTGTFNTIDWGNGPYFIETAVDITGGTNYVTISTTQFMSVPYALYAKNAGLDSSAVQAMIDTAVSSSSSSGFSVRTGTANYSGYDVPVYTMNIDTIFLASGQWVEFETDISISHGNTGGSYPFIGVSVGITNTSGDEVINSGSFSATTNTSGITGTAQGNKFIKNMSGSTKMYIITGSTSTSFTSTGSYYPYANRNASWNYQIKKY